MAWDDELDRLTNYVQDNLGETALDAAIGRAYCQLIRSEPEAFANSDADGIVDLIASGGMMVVADDGRQWSLDQMYEALRVELRSFVRLN